jgi:signal transduction histidine kinase
MAVLLVVAGALQYLWNNQIKRAAEVSMGADLESVMIKWHLDFYGEFSTVCVVLQIGPDSGERDSWEDYLHRYAQWSQAANSKGQVENLYVNRDLVRDIYIWETSRGSSPRLLRLNAEKEKIERSAIAADMQSLLAHLKRNSSSLRVALRAWASDDSTGERHRESEERPSPSHLLRSNAETGWQFDERLPALVHPIFHYVRHRAVDTGNLSSLDSVDWVVVVLNLETIKKRILPDLMQRYFHGNQGLAYKLAVIAEGKTSGLLYSSDAGFGTRDVAASDSVMNIFGPPPESTEGHLWQSEKNRVSVKGEDWRRFSGPVWFPIIQHTSEGGPWVLVLRGRTGPLDAAVTRVWRSNLVFGGLTLLLLLTTIVLVVIASQHAQTLANLQIDFVASISHELHTPLTVILSASENLTDGFVDGKQSVFQHGSIIKRQARRLKELVGQILLFASMGNGKSRYILRRIEVSQLLECAREYAAALTEGAAFAIEEQTEGQLPSVMGDLPALSQCLQNLIANAVKYSETNRWIGIRAAVHELRNHRTEVRISIQDHGIGIDSAELPHVFEAFYRSPSVTAAQIRGTGLGLTVARRIAQGMGGELTVKSELGVGSVFTLHLPAANELAIVDATAVLGKPGATDE